MVIFRIFFNLMRLALRLFWLPVFLLSRNLFLVILLVVGVVIYLQFQDAEQPAQLTPASADPVVQSQPQPVSSGQILVEVVRKREDGNSAFAADLYSLMNDQERAYYSQLFFWAMTNLPTGQPHAWVNGNMNGMFTPTRTFTNASGTTCRNFSEVLKVRSIEQTLAGIACQKPGGSWCKLKANATPACGLSGERGLWDSLKDLF